MLWWKTVAFVQVVIGRPHNELKWIGQVFFGAECVREDVLRVTAIMALRSSDLLKNNHHLQEGSFPGRVVGGGWFR